jgi:hypothetical protein
MQKFFCQHKILSKTGIKLENYWMTSFGIFRQNRHKRRIRLYSPFLAQVFERAKAVFYIFFLISRGRLIISVHEKFRTRIPRFNRWDLPNGPSRAESSTKNGRFIGARHLRATLAFNVGIFVSLI